MESGVRFYEKQAPGVGEYFWDTVHAEIDSLILYAGIHRIVHGMHRLLNSAISLRDLLRNTRRGGLCMGGV